MVAGVFLDLGLRRVTSDCVLGETSVLKMELAVGCDPAFPLAVALSLGRLAF